MPIAKNNDPGHKVIMINPLHIKNATKLYFNSIITDFSDSYTPRWTPLNVYGRMDPLSTYSGTDRTLTLGFRVISEDKTEAAYNMRNIQKLIQYQYPTYTTVSRVNILAAPPYFQFKFLNAVGGTRSSLEGYINGAIEINPGFQAKDQSQFFTTDLENFGSSSKLLFSDVTVVLRIQVLHEGLIGTTVTHGKFNDGKGGNTSYPYGIESIPPRSAATPPQNQNNSGEPSPPPGSSKETTSTGGTKKKGVKTVKDTNAAKKNQELKNKTKPTAFREFLGKKGKKAMDRLDEVLEDLNAFTKKKKEEKKDGGFDIFGGNAGGTVDTDPFKQD